MHYRPNTPKVIFEAFEDEVLVIDFDSGRYFSMRGSAFDVWQLMAAGCGDAAIIEKLSTHHGAPLQAVQPAVYEHFRRMLDERLVVESAEAGACDACTVTTGGPFVAPVMELFTDMQELLLLDPIHEVDQKGWPKRADEK